MRVRRKVTLVVEYEPDEHGFPAEPSEWAWEELIGETVLSVQSEDSLRVDFQVGDVVRLTGQTWIDDGLFNQVVTIEDVLVGEGPVFSTGDEHVTTWCIWADMFEDYSATLVTAAEEVKHDDEA